METVRKVVVKINHSRPISWLYRSGFNYIAFCLIIGALFIVWISTPAGLILALLGGLVYFIPIIRDRIRGKAKNQGENNLQP